MPTPNPFLRFLEPLQPFSIGNHPAAHHVSSFPQSSGEQAGCTQESSTPGEERVLLGGETHPEGLKNHNARQEAEKERERVGIRGREIFGAADEH